VDCHFGLGLALFFRRVQDDLALNLLQAWLACEMPLVFGQALATEDIATEAAVVPPICRGKFGIACLVDAPLPLRVWDPIVPRHDGGDKLMRWSSSHRTG